MAPRITVVVRTVNDSIPQFEDFLSAMKLQEGVPFRLQIVDSSDHEQFREKVAGIDFVSYNRVPGKNLCEGRNFGLEQAETDYVAMTDPDCVPAPGWLAALCGQLDAGAVVTGGRIVPRWLGRPPWLVRRAYIARTHLSLRDLGDTVVETDRVFGANMAFCKSKLGADFRFREDLDRVDGILLGGGDTEFCERAREKGNITYTPEAQVEHQIPPRRLKWGWTLKRVYFAGVSRTFRGGRPKAVSGLKFGFADYIFMAIAAPWYKWGQFRGKKLRRQQQAGTLVLKGEAEYNDAADRDAEST